MRNGMKNLALGQCTGRLSMRETRHVERKRARLDGKHELQLVVDGETLVIVAQCETGNKREHPAEYNKRQEDNRRVCQNYGNLIFVIAH